MNDCDDLDVDRFHFNVSFPPVASCSAAVIAEAIEVDSKPFKFTLPQTFEVKVFQCYTCMYK